LEADLATLEGVDKFYDAARGRPIDALLANAGHGLGGAFLEQDFNDILHVIGTNITGTIYLIQKVGRDMQSRNRGRILITGSIAGFTPGTYNAVYNATKAFIDSFSFALRSELSQDQGTADGALAEIALRGIGNASERSKIPSSTRPSLECPPINEPTNENHHGLKRAGRRSGPASR
jgi:hypothetical protein